MLNKDSYQGPVPPQLRSKAWLCALVNQLAFPGLGTVMAGLKVGYFQAALMLPGFFLLLGFLIWFFTSLLRYEMLEMTDRSRFMAEFHRYEWAGLWGLGLTLVSWCWALVSSINIVRRSVKEKR